MAGVTSTGFIKKTLAEIKSEWEATFKQKFGNSINLLPPSNMATIIGICSDREADIWDDNEESWNSRARSTAQGVSLDNVGELSLDERISAEPSVIKDQLFFGVVGTTVDSSLILAVAENPLATFSPIAAYTLIAGVTAVQKLSFSTVPDSGTWIITMPDGQVTTSLAFGALAAAVQSAVQLLEGWDGVTVTGSYSSGFTFTFLDGVTVGSAALQPQPAVVGTGASLTTSMVAVVISQTDLTVGVAQATGTVQATGDGPTIADAGTLSVINTPVTGLTATKNVSDAAVGRLIETDDAYRQRQAQDIQGNSSSTVEAIRVGLKKVASVVQAIVYENVTMSTDGNNVPPKSIHAYVDGGANQDILNALWLLVGGGIQAYGTVTGTVIDSQGISQTLAFDRPTIVPVYTVVVISKGPLYPTNGNILVAQAIEAYGVDLQIGDDVLLYPALLPAIVNNVPGITDISVKIGLSPSPSTSANISIDPNALATFPSGNISVSSS